MSHRVDPTVTRAAPRAGFLGVLPGAWGNGTGPRGAAGGAAAGERSEAPTHATRT